jgi:endonuclease III
MTPQTKHLIDQKALTKMKRSAYLINTSRGPVVDEGALAWALKERLIAGAALDVRKEPEITPGLARERVVDCPGERHHRDRTAMAESQCNAIAVLNGQAPPPQAVGRRRGSKAGAGHAARRSTGRAARGRKISESQQEDPFQILIATLLSARTQDATTHAASTRLFKRAGTARTMAKLPVEEIRELIYPVSFYRNKADHVKATAGIVAQKYRGRVPDTLDELVTLPGVGRKTASLVMILAFQSRRHICVDTHVHRIANRLGWVRTKTPAQTEQALYENTDARWWSSLNLYLVTWGQNVCRPVYPLCGGCVVADLCPKIGVTKVGKGSTLQNTDR